MPKFEPEPKLLTTKITKIAEKRSKKHEGIRLPAILFHPTFDPGSRSGAGFRPSTSFSSDVFPQIDFAVKVSACVSLRVSTGVSIRVSKAEKWEKTGSESRVEGRKSVEPVERDEEKMMMNRKTGEAEWKNHLD